MDLHILPYSVHINVDSHAPGKLRRTAECLYIHKISPPTDALPNKQSEHAYIRKGEETNSAHSAENQQGKKGDDDRPIDCQPAIPDIHHFIFTADFKRLHSREVYSRGYPDNDINSSIWDQANDWTSNTPKESKYEQTMVSFLARLGYSFDDRYFLVGSVRRDASSKLPTSKNYDWFPSVSGSWKLSSEKFFQNAGLDKVFDLVKFRAGWGRIGNVDLYPNNVATVELLNYQYPIIFGQNLDQLLQGTYLNTIPNYSARWETTEQTSAGLDLTMFKNKLNISVDYYHKVTKDLIDYIPTPEQIGVADPPMGNMGNVLNKGWEFSVNYNGSAAQGKLTYNVWGNFSTNKGYVREYGVRQGAVMHTSPNLNSNPILFSDAGQPWYSFMVYRTAGIFRSQDEINKYIYKNPETGEAKLLMPDAKVGDLIFIDTNNDGVINDDDKTFAGSYTPKNTFSFGGSLNWKGFDFSFFFQGVTGTIRRAARRASWRC